MKLTEEEAISKKCPHFIHCYGSDCMMWESWAARDAAIYLKNNTGVDFTFWYKAQDQSDVPDDSIKYYRKYYLNCGNCGLKK